MARRRSDRADRLTELRGGRPRQTAVPFVKIVPIVMSPNVARVPKCKLTSVPLPRITEGFGGTETNVNAPIAQQRYTPFGAALDPDAALDRHLGIYAAEFGRFLSPGWYILENPNRAVSVPQGFNVYSYTINNPVSLIRRTRRRPWKSILAYGYPSWPGITNAKTEAGYT